MKKISKKFSIVLILGFCSALFYSTNIKAQAFNQGFDDITTLTAAGWFGQNNSTVVGTTSWFQGNSDVFSAQSGAATSYIGANFNNTTGTNTISNWLITPNVELKNGDVLSFYTRTTSDNTYPDRLQVRMSTNGTSTDVGTGPTAVGDFTTLLLDINPSLVISVYPYLEWGYFSITITGLSAPVSGRFAFRYFVTNGGPSGSNSDYIGIDNVVYTPFVCPAVTMTDPISLPIGETGQVYSTLITQTGAIGTHVFSITGGSLPNGISLSSVGVLSGIPTLSGSFDFTISVASDYNCSTSTDYSIQINCLPNPIVFPEFEPLCSNVGNVLLSSATPSGGVYSGTGVTSNIFNPESGSQTITYTYTNSYGCVYTDNNDIIINMAPEVSHPNIDPVCINNGLITLHGGLPDYGTYLGTGISGNTFDPEVGSQTVNYIVTEGNGCSDTAYINILVYDLTVLTAMEDVEICEGNTVALTAITNGTQTWYISGSPDEITNLNVSPGETTEYVVISQNGVCQTEYDTVLVTVKYDVGPAGPIFGETVVCQGENSILYSIEPIPPAFSYEWTLPNGATGSSTTNEIVVNYSIWAVSGTISVYAIGECGEGSDSELNITVNTKPPTPIIIQSGNTLISNSSNGNQWYNDNGMIDEANTQFFNPDGDGNYYTIITINGCSSDPSNSISFIFNGTANNIESRGLSIYPNPVNDKLTVKNLSSENIVDIEISDALGQILYSEKIIGSTDINVKDLKQGIYFVKAFIEGKTEIIKFVKE